MQPQMHPSTVKQLASSSQIKFADQRLPQIHLPLLLSLS